MALIFCARVAQKKRVAMDGKWNPEKEKYELVFDAEELGILRVALALAHYSSKDPDYVKLAVSLHKIMEW